VTGIANALPGVRRCLGQIRPFLVSSMMAFAVRSRWTKLSEIAWQYRGKREVLEGMRNSRHPHRTWILNEIATLARFDSVLEFGCGGGPNLALFAERFPAASIIGIDVNPDSIRYAREHLAQRTMGSVDRICGNSGTLAVIPTASVDLVLTDPALMFIGPREIRGVLADLIRISRSALVLCEFHRDENTPNDSDRIPGSQYSWTRDYAALISALSFDVEVQVKKIPPGFWANSPRGPNWVP